MTGNLYHPDKPGRFPAVLKGSVVLAYDPIAQDERIQAYDRRFGATLGG